MLIYAYIGLGVKLLYTFLTICNYYTPSNKHSPYVVVVFKILRLGLFFTKNLLYALGMRLFYNKATNLYYDLDAAYVRPMKRHTLFLRLTEAMSPNEARAALDAAEPYEPPPPPELLTPIIYSKNKFIINHTPMTFAQAARFLCRTYTTPQAMNILQKALDNALSTK
jgi:hypothetical protein